MMAVKTHKMSDNSADQDGDEAEREREMRAREARRAAADKIAASARRAIRRASHVPERCGPEIIPAPARGAFEVERVRHLEGNESNDFVFTRRGRVRREPIRCADVFDVMGAQAERRGQAHPLTPAQIDMGRGYRALVEHLAGDGHVLSAPERVQAGEGGSDWMDRRLRMSDEVRRLHRRIGEGAALAVRRIRPSDNGGAGRRTITDRALVDMVCITDHTVPDVLRAHGWQADGRGCIAVMDALSAALDRMIGYECEKGP